MKKLLSSILSLLASLMLFTSCPTPDSQKTAYTIPVKVSNFIERNNVDKINPKIKVIEYNDKKVLMSIKNENDSTYEDFLVDYVFIEWLESCCLQPKFGYSYAKEPISFEINALSAFKHDQRIYEILNIMFPDITEETDNAIVKYRFKDYSYETYKDAVSKIDDLFWECKTEVVKHSESVQNTIYPFDLLQLFKIYKFASSNANQYYYYGLTSIIKNSFDDYDPNILSYLKTKGAESILEEVKE